MWKGGDSEGYYGNMKMPGVAAAVFNQKDQFATSFIYLSPRTVCGKGNWQSSDVASRFHPSHWASGPALILAGRLEDWNESKDWKQWGGYCHNPCETQWWVDQSGYMMQLARSNWIWTSFEGSSNKIFSHFAIGVWKSKVKDESSVFGLSSWKNEVVIFFS